MQTNRLSNKRINQSGFTLIEIMISVFVISIGLLGLGGLQVVSMKGTSNAHFRTEASLLVMNLSDRMRANKPAVDLGLYENEISCSSRTTLCRSSTCTSKELARFDIQEVMCGVKRGSKREGGVKNLLPNGAMTVTCEAGCEDPGPLINPKRQLSIVISWAGLTTEENEFETQCEDDSNQCLIVPVIP